ncbi:MAG: response regulator [Nitrospirota bacterium]
MEEEFRILCVDDEKNVLRAIERIFLDENYEVLSASSADEGLEILNTGKPVQIVISDYRMPGKNGVDFLKEVCERWPDTVRIVLSGYADAASIVSAINDGQIYKFIPKPWNDDELKVTISNAFERYFLQKKNLELTEELRRRNDELNEINDNLEKLVSVRNAELVFQNKALIRSQNILNSLPIAVLGIDTDGMIVQCNEKGLELFGRYSRNIIGMDRKDLLPSVLNAFIERVFEKRALSGHILIEGTDIKVKGISMRQPDGQEGIILTLDKED